VLNILHAVSSRQSDICRFKVMTLSSLPLFVNWPAFTARRHAGAVCVSRAFVCLSVCLSQVGVLLKQLNIGSHKQCHTIAQGLWCRISQQNSNGVTPNGGAKCRWGRLKLATFDK